MLPEEKWVLASDGFAGLEDEYEQYTMLKDYIPSTQISDKQLQDADSRIFIANDNPLYCRRFRSDKTYWQPVSAGESAGAV